MIGSATLISSTSNSRHLLVHKALMYFIFLFVNFTITYRVLLVTELAPVELVMEMIYVGSLGLYLLYRISKRIFEYNFRFNSLEIYLGLLMLLPILPAIASNVVFGQPLLYGFGTFQDFYLLVGALVVYNMLRSNEVSIELVEKAFVAVTWFNVLMFYFLSLFTDPAALRDTGLAGGNSVKGSDVYYRFNMTFIFFGSIYYGVKAFYKKNYLYLGYAAIFLVYLIFFRMDRTSMAVTAAALLLFFFTALRLREQVLHLSRFLVPIFGGVLIVWFFLPEIYDQYYLMFEDAVSTVVGGTNAEGEESVRVYEMKVALEYIDKNPLMGNGKVSSKWIPGGYDYFFGFFYPSDIGIFGQIFMFGYIGAFLLYFQYLLAFFYLWRIRHIKRNTFLTALKFLLLALFLDNLTNGYITIYAAHSLTVLAIIFYFYQLDRSKNFLPEKTETII